MFDGYHVYVRFRDFSVLEPVRVFKDVEDVLAYARAVLGHYTDAVTVGVWYNAPHNARIGCDNVFEWVGYGA